uniref:Uncharacterized protein n=1 Tax=Pediastrum angulosum TaxID=271408 RepID=A0A2U8GHX8_9CHLO|nr:hypothetical protein [Pediastrum angulosum]
MTIYSQKIENNLIFLSALFFFALLLHLCFFACFGLLLHFNFLPWLFSLWRSLRIGAAALRKTFCSAAPFASVLRLCRMCNRQRDQNERKASLRNLQRAVFALVLQFLTPSAIRLC